MNTLVLRRWHGWIGAFIAPSVFFFALTGSLQLFSLHEAHGDYRPAPILERLSSVHKDQVFAPGHHHASQPAAAKGAAGTSRSAPDDDRPAISTLLLKSFFLAVALALALSTAFGVLIGLARPGGRATTIALLVAGTAIPLILLVV